MSNTDRDGELDKRIDEIFVKAESGDGYTGMDGWYELHTPTIRVELKKLLEDYTTSQVSEQVDIKEISYILGCIDVDLEQYGTSYSQSQIDWINKLKDRLTL